MSEATPPEQERRKDVNTRKVIEVLSAKLDEKLNEKLRGHVAYPVFFGLLVAFLGLAAIVAAAIATPAKDRAAAVEARQDRLETGVQSDVKALTTAIQKLEISAAKTEATYRVIVEGVPRATAKAEVPSAKPNR